MKDVDLRSEKSSVTKDLTKEILSKVMKEAPHSDESENLKKWYSDYIDYFREEYEKLTDEEKKCVSNSKNFLNPSQIEVFWTKDPSCQLIIQSNFKDRSDKEIIINGPFSSHEFFEKTSPILRETRWQKKIEGESLSKYYDSETYGEDLAKALHSFIEIVKNEQFHPLMPDGYAMGHSRGIIVWFQYFRGNIANINLKTDVVHLINEIKDEAKRRTQSDKTPTPSVSTQSEYDGYGVHMFPPVIVGKRKKPTPGQLLQGNTLDFSFSEKIFDIKFDNKIMIVNKDGYVFVETDQKLEGLRILNLIMALGLFHDLSLYTVKEHELSQASFNKETKTIGGMTWNRGSIRSYLFDIPFGTQVIEHYEKREIDKEKFKKILDDAKIIIKFEKLSEELRLFNEANTHLINSEYAQSFIMSWSVIERFYSDTWRKKLDQKDMDEERLNKLTNSAQWSIDYVLEVLNLGGEIDENSFDLLMELKRKRNRFYHRGKQVTKEDAERCLAYAHLILVDKISKAKQGLPE